MDEAYYWRLINIYLCDVSGITMAEKYVFFPKWVFNELRHAKNKNIQNDFKIWDPCS